MGIYIEDSSELSEAEAAVLQKSRFSEKQTRLENSTKGLSFFVCEQKNSRKFSEIN